MKLALLGADDEALALVESALRTEGAEHELVAAFDVLGFERAIRELAPRCRLDEDWETLLLGSLADLVIVARGQAALSEATGVSDDDRRAEQFRKLTQAAVPMLVFCPACEAIVGYEIEMIRADSHGVLFPYVPDIPLENIRDLAAIAAQGEDSPIGRVEQFLVEREMADRRRPQVLAQLARDMSVVRQLAGKIVSVAASGPPLPAGRDPLGPKTKALPPLANLSVHLQGERGLACRWSVGPVTSEAAVRFTLVGTEGRAVLAQDQADSSWTLYLPGDMQRLAVAEPGDRVRAVLAECEEILADKREVESAWLDACRDQEVAEAIDRSLLRGRTIELFNEEHTQAGSFKGVMAMGGCLMLMVALFGVLAATLVEGLQLPMRNWAAWQLWPVFLLVPIGLFLLLQVFQLAVPKPKTSAPSVKVE